LSLEAKLDLLDMLERYAGYGWTRTAVCRKWEISLQIFRSLKKEAPRSGRPRRTRLNAVTDEEKRNVIQYALTHTELNHREMTFRMIDGDVAFLSTSSVYRILRENNLLKRRRVKERIVKWDPHSSLSGPDEVWQTDLMVLTFEGRDYYLLSYFDVYSRFVVYDEICSSMTGDTIRNASERAVKETGRKPKVIQSDNGSCYVSSEFRSFIGRSEIEHRQIHPHCPNENAEIERYHRTVRELVDPSDAGNYTALLDLVKERIRYYSYERYHSAVGYVTPYDMYCGRAEAILESRKRKLQRAKENRIKANLEKMKAAENDQHKKAA